MRSSRLGKAALGLVFFFSSLVNALHIVHLSDLSARPYIPTATSSQVPSPSSSSTISSIPPPQMEFAAYCSPDGRQPNMCTLMANIFNDGPSYFQIRDNTCTGNPYTKTIPKSIKRPQTSIQPPFMPTGVEIVSLDANGGFTFTWGSHKDVKVQFQDQKTLWDASGPGSDEATMMANEGCSYLPDAKGPRIAGRCYLITFECKKQPSAEESRVGPMVD